MDKKCFIIAGPNGAGKTTFAKDFLPTEGNCINYINADLIAAGIAPFAPETRAVEAGKIMLKEMAKCVKSEESFALETTLSGTTYSKKIQTWKKHGYEIILLYFSLPSQEMAINRVKNRVKQGGHNIPEADIRRRFDRSKKNLETIYKSLADVWIIFDTSALQPKIIERSNNEQ